MFQLLPKLLLLLCLPMLLLLPPLQVLCTVKYLFKTVPLGHNMPLAAWERHGGSGQTFLPAL
jgi:hypothetical protein